MPPAGLGAWREAATYSPPAAPRVPRRHKLRAFTHARSFLFALPRRPGSSSK